LLSWSVGTLAFTRAARRIDPGLLNKTRLLLAVFGTGTIACIAYGHWPWELLTTPSAAAWLWLTLSGIVGLTVGDFFGFTSLMILGARRQSVVGTVAPVFALVGGWLLLGERLTWLSLAGTTFAVGGVMWSMSGAEERSDVHKEGYGSFSTGILMAIGGAACQGFGLVLAKMGMQADGVGAMIPPFHAAFMRMVAGFSSIYVFDRIRRAPAVRMADAFRSTSALRPMLLGAISGPILGVSMSLLAASRLGAGMAQTIFSMVPFVVMGIVTVMEGEPLRPRVVVGALVAIGGVILLLNI
ncbi:MAG: DMT family transporter, partial [Candidatus Kapabacteria bacterium]|nr:DMT family transporter [Candidatus Kapabacteria bacterium]